MPLANSLECALLEPDREAMHRMVHALFRGSMRGKVLLQGLFPRHRPEQPNLCGAVSSPRALNFDLTELDDLVETAVLWNRQPGCSVYVSAGLRREDIPVNHSGGNSDVIAVTALKADLDADGALDAAIEKITQAKLLPNLIVETARTPYRRGHLWWILDEPETDLLLVREIEEGLRSWLAGDAVTDARRIMRLAGSINSSGKAGRMPEIVRLIERRAAAYTMDELRATVLTNNAFEPQQAVAAKPANSGSQLRRSSKLANHVRAFDVDGAWHSNVRDAAASLVAQGVPLDAIEELLVRAARQPGFTLVQTQKDVRRLVGSAKRKFAPKESVIDGEYSLADLQTQELPERAWVANGLLPEGLAMLAAKPKAGKSWLGLDLAVSVSAGQPFLKTFDTIQGDVLYCALEDSPRRMQERANAMLGDGPWPERLSIRHGMPRLDAGGADIIDKWVARSANPRLCILDVWSLVKPTPHRKADEYDSNYAAIAPLKKLVADGHICILLIHHLRKMPPSSDDAFETILGSTAIRGGMDALFLLSGNMGKSVLKREGRDLEDTHEIELSFNRDTCRFDIRNAQGERSLTEQERQVLGVLSDYAEVGCGVEQLANALDLKPLTAKQRIQRMQRRNLVCHRGGGRYAATNKIQ